MIKRFKISENATIYSNEPLLNTSLDEILELNNINYTYNSVKSRILLNFNKDEISNTLLNISSSYDMDLNIFMCDAKEIPLNFTIDCFPIYNNWKSGYGKKGNIPSSTKGVNWKYSYDTNIFTSSVSNTTSSYYPNSIGGGGWKNNISSSQYFKYNDSLDLKIPIKNIFNHIDNGLIIKLKDDLSLTNDGFIQYYSNNTHTIYQPYIELRWDDSINLSGSLQYVNNEFIISIKNNKGVFLNNEIIKFELNVRDKYPTRILHTSSLYTNNKLLPIDSFYAIKDIKSNEYVIDFSQYTKISSDGNGNYFYLDMNNLYPNRYYSLVIKSIFLNQIFIFEDKNFIKIE